MLGDVGLLEHMEVSQLTHVVRQLANEGTTLQQSGSIQQKSNTTKTNAIKLVTPLGLFRNRLKTDCSS